MNLPKHISGPQIFPLAIWDGLGVAVAFLAALAFRFDGHIPTRYWDAFIYLIPAAILLYCLVNALYGLYAHLWRYANAYEVSTIFIAVTTATALFWLGIQLYPFGRPLPNSVVLLGGLLTSGFFTSFRYRQRLLTGAMGRLEKLVGSANRKRVVIVGAGEAGQLLARQFGAATPHGYYELVGFVDDDPAKQGMYVQGVPVLGDRTTIPSVVALRGVGLIVIAIHRLEGPSLRELLSICLATPARVKLLPDFLGSIDQSEKVLPLQDISPDDLLGRQSPQVDESACRALIAGKVVLITGAAGSIGSELSRQVLAYGPRQLLLLDNNETGLYDLMLTLSHTTAQPSGRAVDIIPLVADVTRAVRLEQFFAASRPNLVFHAAAYKHVPLMEQYPGEAVRVNIGGTQNLVNLSAKYGVERFVLISSDKAINPSSVMGATKRAGELILRSVDTPALANPFNGRSQRASSTLFTAVRFGNVLGSRGSVVPTFTRQIELGGPVTITHPGMSRYFMSIPEAVSLVIQAAALTEGGDIFMLDMGQEIRISDLAHKMIRLRGLRPGLDIPLVYTGIRPGEKLHEELLAPTEDRQATPHAKIFRIRRAASQPALRTNVNAQVAYLLQLADQPCADDLIAALWRLVKAEAPATNGHTLPVITLPLGLPREGQRVWSLNNT